MTKPHDLIGPGADRDALTATRALTEAIRAAVDVIRRDRRQARAAGNSHAPEG